MHVSLKSPLILRMFLFHHHILQYLTFFLPRFQIILGIHRLSEVLLIMVYNFHYQQFLASLFRLMGLRTIIVVYPGTNGAAHGTLPRTTGLPQWCILLLRTGKRRRFLKNP